jgi:hypothetical protein
METEKRIIEINGVKMEIDLRDCKVIENFRVGDNIKVLVKNYSTYSSYVGVIIGFDNFKTLPTVVIAYLETSYSDAKIHYVYFNAESKDVEICPLNDWDIPITKVEVLKRFDKELENKKREAEEVENKKAVFTKLFGKYFEERTVKYEQPI